MKTKKSSRRRIDVNLDELDQIIDRGTRAPLSESEGQKLKTALHAMAKRLSWKRSTEKTSAVLNTPTAAASTGEPPKDISATTGHGRNSAAAFTGANRVRIAHGTLHSGDPCPECREGRIYRQKEPATLVRIVGKAPLEATVFEMERLRCNACGEVFTAAEPENAGSDKYDVTAVAMIALLKYGTGVPFKRLEKLEAQLGMPLPAATQWELMEAAARPMRPVLDELIRQAAQGSVIHNDDTSVCILQLTREPGDKRTGTFTSGIVSMGGVWTIALFFSGWKHAGENIGAVLKQRARELPAPIQMCDALSRNTPKLEGIEILLANCLAHGRRQIVEVAENFPEECRYVLETLGGVYHNDALTREQKLSAEDRLGFHQEYSGPLMNQLHEWMEAQLVEHKTEPNSGLGKAISYLLKHWVKLTLFLRQAGAPIDNNIVERALKKAILNRKNALFYKTVNGAGVGDLFMSLIHTCQLNGANPLDYLTQLQRHAAELPAHPAEWMPWNYRKTLAQRAEVAA
ncbi:MAG TPA: IS66 family transposase [Candidatus Solibacter sp.]|nr:IS66 family transposase [Candidatus Solibacter sp.]